METKRQKRNTIIIIAIIVAIFIIIPLILFIIHTIYSAKLTTTIAPSFATLEIDGKTYPINTELSLKPQQTTAIISAEGFQRKEISLNLIKDETISIATYLVPNDGDLSWYYNNPEENTLFENVGGQEAAKNALIFLEEYPISEILPLSFADIVDGNPINYRIDIGKFEACKTNFCLKISDYTGLSREHALNLIRSKGYNPDNYQIIYQKEPEPVTNSKRPNRPENQSSN